MRRIIGVKTGGSIDPYQLGIFPVRLLPHRRRLDARCIPYPQLASAFAQRPPEPLARRSRSMPTRTCSPCSCNPRQNAGASAGCSSLLAVVAPPDIELMEIMKKYGYRSETTAPRSTSATSAVAASANISAPTTTASSPKPTPRTSKTPPRDSIGNASPPSAPRPLGACPILASVAGVGFSPRIRIPSTTPIQQQRSHPHLSSNPPPEEAKIQPKSYSQTWIAITTK